MCPARSADPAATLTLCRPARVDDATALRRALAQWAGARGLPAPLVSDVELAAYEALMNAVEHAYAGGTPGDVEIHARQDRESLRVTVTDHGHWQPVRRAGSLHGRGVPLIRLLADRADFHSGTDGTTVTMTWHLPSAGPG
ncbi:ATP-binding protein [Amycolatopsis sp. FDAARGOS 1241]|uniref:ATP-binding protein n=1 Tax=Amycolatopsis sp. FDAARGOS 1241 TaxID=2778070 RepID=UPI00194FC377|nr:ATP-binding protein [Amycolatopsis sp. FDAARGOS 1241]QRP49685.1 ATP-binding protein [Amycolatopsis sp. FDAARGOS 1241]